MIDGGACVLGILWASGGKLVPNRLQSSWHKPNLFQVAMAVVSLLGVFLEKLFDCKRAVIPGVGMAKTVIAFWWGAGNQARDSNK